MKKKVLLVNPPVYDFAAFDLWAKPLGLLYLSSILKQSDIEVAMLDYMDRYFQRQEAQSNKYGGGHYNRQVVKKPEVLQNIPRDFARYGIPKEQAEQYLQNIVTPEIVLVTSIMTYWYPGVFEAIGSIKKIFPKTPVVLGGVYATLCGEHAKKSGADYIVKGSFESLNGIFNDTGICKNNIFTANFQDFSLPDYSFYPVNNYICLRASMGCPFSCSYCAQNILCNNTFTAKTPEQVFGEIKYFAESGINNFAFYDDALLYKPEELIKPLLKKITESNLNINIHTPNGLHIKYLDKELAGLMKKAGFVSPRFSLETSNIKTQSDTGSKTTNAEFENAVAMLNNAGYRKGEYTVYLLMGMPGQSLSEVEESVRYANSFGAKVSISEYSIIPQTKDFAKIDNKYLEEPLYHNKSVYPLFDVRDWKEIYKVKQLAIKLNSLL